MGRSDTASRENVSVAMSERIERIDYRGLLVADHPHFPEIDTERGQIFRDIANVLVLGAARQDLVADHHERGNLFGSVNSCHSHLRKDAKERRRRETARQRNLQFGAIAL
jgi:hypothetical protein